MTTVYALQGDVEAWIELPKAVSDSKWTQIVKAALGKGGLAADKATVMDYAPQVEGQRQLWGRGVTSAASETVFQAMLEACSGDRWQPRSGDHFFNELSENGPEAKVRPLQRAAWTSLLELGRHNRATSNWQLPEWLRLAYPEMYKGLASPAQLTELLAKLDGSDALKRFSKLLGAEAKLPEAAEAEQLIEFLRSAAAKGEWILGTEWVR